MAKKRATGQSDHEPVSEAARVLGEKIRARREAMGMTKYVLSKRTGISAQGILLLEGGRRETSWERIQLLSMVLGLALEDLRDPNLEPRDYTPAGNVKRGRPKKQPAPEVEQPSPTAFPEPAKKPAGKTGKPAG